MGRQLGIPDSPRRELYVGRLRLGTSTVAPEAHLEFFDWGIRVQIRSVLGALGAPYEFRYPEITGAKLTGRMVMRGVALETDTGLRPLVFVTVDSAAILRLLNEHGVRTSNEAVPLPSGDGLSQLLERRGFLIFFFSLAVPAALVGMVITYLATTARQEDVTTLRHVLAAIHLPAGYHLVSEHSTRTDCKRQGCSVTQTWAWQPAGGRSRGAQCTDADSALSAAFSDVEYASPRLPGEVCDYDTLVASFLHPGEGKPSIDATVRTAGPRSDDYVVTLRAYYTS